MKVFLFNQYAGNKGDRAVLYALCFLIGKVVPKPEIVVSTSDPDLWRDAEFPLDIKIRFVPSAWDYNQVGRSIFRIYWLLLRRVKKYTFTVLREMLLRHWHGGSRFFCNPLFFEKLKESDIAVSVGGHHFTTLLSRDLVSSINFDAMCVFDSRKRYVMFSQSFGPFLFCKNRNKKITRMILDQSSGLYAREESSIEALKEFGINERMIRSTWETVLSLNHLFPERTPVADRHPRIGISIYSAQKRPREDLEAYCGIFAGFVLSAISQGFQVVFFPMELKDSAPDDRPCIKKIMDMAGNPPQCIMRDEDLPSFRHLKEISQCRYFVGHKTHSTIFALLTGTPLIGICYHPKTRAFMKQFGVEKFAVDDCDLTLPLLKTRWEELKEAAEDISSHCFSQAAKMAGELEEQMREILAQEK